MRNENGKVSLASFVPRLSLLLRTLSIFRKQLVILCEQEPTMESCLYCLAIVFVCILCTHMIMALCYLP